MKWPWRKEKRTDRWDKQERNWTNFSLGSKRGLALLVLAYFGVMYLIHMSTIAVQELMYYQQGYYPAP